MGIDEEIVFLLEEGDAEWNEMINKQLLLARSRCNKFRAFFGLEPREYVFNTSWNCIEKCPLYRTCPELNFKENDEE